MQENNEIRRKNSSPDSSKSKTKRPRKRKRISSGSSSDDLGVLPANTLKVEKNLQAAAAKNNLDDKSVKKILKKMVLNDHVLALVKLQEEEEVERSSEDEEDSSIKLTRSKAKQLKKSSPNWELTPIKHIPVKTRPEVEALIAQELPDESDEEYEPTQDDVPSDEDQTLESCSDVESQPRTPATPKNQPSNSPKICIKDGPFKVPQELKTPAKRRQQLEEEEATIALRTRSKLSLSETPIEHIEQSFVPPDEPPQRVGDDLWNKFLEECLDPAPSFRNEDDDETDPEYSVAADPDAQEEDEEALESSLIKISRKELNDLMTELMHLMPESEADNQPDNSDIIIDNRANFAQCGKWEGKQEPVSDNEAEVAIETRETTKFRRSSCVSIGKSELLSDEEHLEYCDDDIQQEPNEMAAETTNSKKSCATFKQISNSDEQMMENKQVLQTSGSNSVVKISLQEHDENMSAPRSEHVAPSILKDAMERDKKSHEIEIRLTPNDKLMLPEQLEIFQQQLRQHIQVATSNFLQLYIHPVHWKLAPKYKEYLETFQKLNENNSKSVVNVCNLEHALELVNSWEQSVSENTSENVEMIKFLQKESDRGTRRYAQNGMYLGKFHPTFLQAVANSHVFLYPYLLPAVPFRACQTRKNSYSRSEDELIALGLDQFWQYVTENPSIYKYPKRHKFRRYGLTEVIDLMRRHMFPWLPHSTILSHINHVRRLPDPDNPINLFFRSREVRPVKHKLLSYNPNISMYEQPEHELPLIWLKYIKTTSQNKRFVISHAKIHGVEPQGVEVDLGESVKPPVKDPLPRSFSRLYRKFDKMISIAPKDSPIHIHINTNTTQNENISNTTTLTTVTTAAATTTQQNVPALFNLVQTSAGAYLIPLTVVQGTTIVNSVQTPIVTASQETAATKKNSTEDELALFNDHSSLTSTIHFSDDDEPIETAARPPRPTRFRYSDCCECCDIVRSRIMRQSKITEYFKGNHNEREKVLCPCKKQSSHTTKVTNQLKLLVQNFKVSSFSAWRHLDESISKTKSELEAKRLQKDIKNVWEKLMTSYENARSEDLSVDYNWKDIALVNTFMMKVLFGSALMKKHVHCHLSKFNPESDSPVYLFHKMSTILKGDDYEIVKEFVQFLAPEQAMKVNEFGNYFLVCLLPLLIARIEEEVSEKEVKLTLLSEVSQLSRENWDSSPCNMCTTLLKHTKNHAKLSEYIFDLFPHKIKSDSHKSVTNVRTAKKKFNNKDTQLESETECNEMDTNGETNNDRIDPDSDSHKSVTNVRTAKKKFNNKDTQPESETECNEMDTNGETNNDRNDPDSVDKNGHLPLLESHPEKENGEMADDDSQLNLQLKSVKMENDIETSKSLENNDHHLENIKENQNWSEETEADVYSERNSEDSPTYDSDSTESMKFEIADWTRDEDKLLLEFLKDSLTPKEIKEKSILEILEEKNVFATLAQNLEHKSIFEIKDRVLYLLALLNKHDS